MNPNELPTFWREKAEQVRRYSEPAANAWEDAACELEAAFAQWQLETLTLAEANVESGYSYSHLQRLVADGAIENVGEPGSPLLRRGDLPRKPGRDSPLALENGDFAEEILTRRERGR